MGGGGYGYSDHTVAGAEIPGRTAGRGGERTRVRDDWCVCVVQHPTAHGRVQLDLEPNKHHREHGDHAAQRRVQRQPVRHCPPRECFLKTRRETSKATGQVPTLPVSVGYATIATTVRPFDESVVSVGVRH